MIPLELTIKGLYSYRYEQTIDFRRLHDARLFGIFGAVGSGKSTVLEAMTYALFGETERLNRSDNRAYNMMNLKSDELLVRFQFLAGPALADEYLFEVQVKRQKKNYEKVGTPKWRRMKRVDGEWIPEERSAVEIIGLSYENFRRTVIIPQGKFQEFLSLTGGERTRMMKELFNLQRFDLLNKTQRLGSRNNEQIQVISGRMQELQVSPDELDTLNSSLKEAREALQQLQKKGEEQRVREKEFARLADLQSKLIEAENALRQLREQEEAYQFRKQNLMSFEECRRRFNAKNEQLNLLKRQVEKSRQELERIKAVRMEQEEEILIRKKAFARVEELFKQNEQRQKEISDLKQLAAIRSGENGLAEKREKLNDQRSLVKQVSARLMELEESTEAQAEMLRKQRKQLPDKLVIAETQEWFALRRHLQMQLDEKKAEQLQLRQTLTDIETTKNSLEGLRQVDEWITPLEQTLPVDELLKHIESVVKKLRSKLKELEKVRLGLIKQQHLGELTAALIDGEPCPVCGSTKHMPQAYSKEPKKSAKEAAEITKLERQLDVLNDLRNELTTPAASYKVTHQRLSELDAAIKSSSDNLALHVESWKWDGYSSENEAELLQARETLQGVEESLQLIEEQQEKMLLERRDAQVQREEAQEALTALEKEYSALTARREAQVEQLEELVIDSMPGWTDERLIAKADELEEKHLEIQRDYERGTEQINSLQKMLDESAGELNSSRKQVDESKSYHNGLQQEFEKEIAVSDFESVESVQALLALDLDAVAESKALEEYFTKLQATELQLKGQQEQMESADYDETQHRLLREDIAGLEKELSAKQQQIGSLESEVQRIESGIKKRAELQKELDALNARKDNIDTLVKLFRGSGFVNFVSSVFLKNLVRAANERFRSLTRNQLSLEVNEDNNFMVRDYLNDGQVRSVKTLSGGQTFQASLCLALALADNIQHLSEASQNFFFLDEGFGTLDKNSLQIIFNTLKAMQKENRIVGVISHVEELQQEIDVYLYIRNEDEKGSEITSSWQ